MPVTLPIQPAILALFISHLYSLTYVSSSVTTYISAISYVHKFAELADPTDSPLIVQVLKGYRELAPVNDVRLPITLPLLRQSISAFNHTISSRYQILLMSAMCAIAFFAFLRIGEITASRSDATNLIDITQLDRLVDDRGITRALQLTICNYKHKNSGPPFVIYIYPETTCCPVQLILNFISMRGPVRGPLFCWPDETPISRTFFVERLNAALKFCNLDTSLYKARSFGSGAASWASAKGFSDSQIRLLGRWKSTAFLRYIRTPSIKTSWPILVVENLCRRYVFISQRSVPANSLRVRRAAETAPCGLFSCPHR